MSIEAVNPSTGDTIKSYDELLKAIQSAAQYGLFDLERVETIILRKLAREYFQIAP